MTRTLCIPFNEIVELILNGKYELVKLIITRNEIMSEQFANIIRMDCYNELLKSVINKVITDEIIDELLSKIGFNIHVARYIDLSVRLIRKYINELHLGTIFTIQQLSFAECEELLKMKNAKQIIYCPIICMGLTEDEIYIINTTNNVLIHVSDITFKSRYLIKRIAKKDKHVYNCLNYVECIPDNVMYAIKPSTCFYKCSVLYLMNIIKNNGNFQCTVLYRYSTWTREKKYISTIMNVYNFYLVFCNSKFPGLTYMQDVLIS